MTEPVKGNIYAVTAGDYMGEFFVLMDNNTDYVFLSLPDFHIRTVSEDKLQIGLDKNILDFREKLPVDIFKECIKKYNEIKSCSSA
jgi:hypothetical protein